jgi:hypothetical protein
LQGGKRIPTRTASFCDVVTTTFLQKRAHTKSRKTVSSEPRTLPANPNQCRRQAYVTPVRWLGYRETHRVTAACAELVSSIGPAHDIVAAIELTADLVDILHAAAG